MSTAAALSLLRQFLETRRAAGEAYIDLSRESLQKLGQLRSQSLQRLREAEADGELLTGEGKNAVADPPASVAEKDPLILTVSGTTRAERLAAVRALAEQAPEARALGTLRETMVFAVGNPEATLMLIGEAPGFQEERQREPFVGPAGEKLTLILKAMGLRREEVYISNICKFRPMTEEGEDQGTRNRKPTEVEMRACLPFVTTEISIVQPRCLVALGATAAEGLGLSGSVSSLRGKRHQVRGIPTVVTFHPSYVLREEKSGDGMRVKRQVWEDMMLAMDILGMPISEKQKSYFKPA